MKKYSLVILLGLFALTRGWTQTNKLSEGDDAEVLFQNILPLGINLKAQHGFWEKGGKGNLYNFNHPEFWMYEAGIDFSFYRANKLNFLVGFNVNHLKYNKFLPLNDNAYNNVEQLQDLELVVIKSSELLFKIPITLEYVNFLTDKMALAISSGLEFQFNGSTNNVENSERSLHSYTVVRLKDDSFADNINLGANFGAGLYQKFIGDRLIKFEVIYHLHFNNIITQHIKVKNSASHPNIISENSWSGNHLDFKVTFFPFSKKSK